MGILFFWKMNPSNITNTSYWTKSRSIESSYRKYLLLNTTSCFPTHLRFIHPGGVGPFAISRTQYVRRVQWYTMLTVIQTGKVVVVPVALADRLVSCCRESLWWSFIIEEIKALGEVVADFTEDQATEPGQEKKQSSCGELQHLHLHHQVFTSAAKRCQWTVLTDFPSDKA